jgi:hypothetical protein
MCGSKNVWKGTEIYEETINDAQRIKSALFEQRDLKYLQSCTGGSGMFEQENMFFIITVERSTLSLLVNRILRYNNIFYRLFFNQLKFHGVQT